jgi:purine-binding chemotaxis protein CheW
MEQLEAIDHATFTRDGGQFLTFTLGEEAYGVEILKVQEIRGYSAITPIPNTPPHVRGVMNLRGAIIPVVDLRLQFGMIEAEYNQFTVIIVVTVGTKTVGVIVDSVSDVLNMARADIQDTPDLGVQVDASVINGIAKAGEKLVALLDIDRVLGGDALGSLN